LEKRKEEMKDIENIERGRLCGLIFLHNTKPSLFEGNKKLYWRKVLDDLYDFFKL